MQYLAAFLFGLTLALTPAGASAEGRGLAHSIFYHDMGYAIGGYDPVSFFVEEEPTHGATAYAVMWKGVTWLFASPEHQALFEANPRAYAPRFGGYCAYGVSAGYLLSGDPNAYEIRNGELFMLHSPEVQTRWRLDPETRLTMAHQNWPDLLRE